LTEIGQKPHFTTANDLPARPKVENIIGHDPVGIYEEIYADIYLPSVWQLKIYWGVP